MSSYVKKELSTVENIYNGLGCHEYYGHGINNYDASNQLHHKSYELQIADPSFDLCTELYKKHILINYFQRIVNSKSKEHEKVDRTTKIYKKAYDLYTQIYNKK